MTMAEHTAENSMHSPTTELERVLLALVNGSPSLMFVKDAAFRYLFVNTFTEYGPHSVDSMVGPTPVGVRHFLTIKFPVYDEAGALIGLAGMVTDITERKRREAERLAARERVIAHQSDELRELSTPLLPIADGVLAMPLIGTISPVRAEEILHTLLRGISAQRARFALIDVTGVHAMDADVATMLVGTARAARLLGTEVVLTGISPSIALALVQLGVDLTGVTTMGTLASGISFALRR
jgi:rsbT co-antagonist protein RsbR